MRSMFSGSYSALDNEGGSGRNDVYRSTTSPSGDQGFRLPNRPADKFNLSDSVKRIFRKSNYSGSGSLRASQSVFVLPHIHEDASLAQVHSSGMSYERLLRRENRSRGMPISTPMEEAALLGCVPSESMDEVELKNIQLSFPSTRSLARGEGIAVEERIETNYGTVLVGVQGDRSKPGIISYHDLGLNYVSNFQAFFNFVDMRLLLQNFCIYHINAPGQEDGAPNLPDNFVYPTMDELAEQVLEVMVHYGLKRIIGFGVGAGANILCRLALAHPEKVDAMCVLNCVSTQAGWIEWGYQKLNTRNLRSKGIMTQGVLDYLMWHHFGKLSEDRNHDLTTVYRQYFESNVNPTNLGLFMDSYIRRTDLNIERCLDPLRKKDVRTLKMPVLNVTGTLSPHVDDTVTFNGRLDPSNSTWMKIQDCGMVLEEQPAKLSEAFRLFLQGQGYALKLFRKNSLPEVPSLSMKKVSQHRKMSVDSGVGGAGSATSSSASINNVNGSGSNVLTPKGDATSINSNTKGIEKGINDIRITENPISESPELKVAPDNPVC